MALGGTVSSMGITLAGLSLTTPLLHTSTPESPTGILIVLALAGVVMSYLAYLLKRGSRFVPSEKKG